MVTASKLDTTFIPQQTTSILNNVVTAAAWGAAGSLLLGYATSCVVSPLTGGVACGISQMTHNALEGRVNSIANFILSNLIGSSLATALGWSISFKACVLCSLAGPVGLFAVTFAVACAAGLLQAVTSPRL